MRMFVFTSFLLLISADAFSVPLATINGTTLVFPAAAAAADKLLMEDPFLSALSPMEISLRMKTAAPRSLEDYKLFLSRQTLDWNPDEIKKMAAIFADIVVLLSGYKAFLVPAALFMVKTTGNEEGHAAYCRGDDIMVLPEAYLRFSDDDLRDIVIHELFHLFSRNNPIPREHLYNLIGFRKTASLSGLESGTANSMIHNPDAYANDFYFQAETENGELDVMPILLAASRYDAGRGGEFFNYLTLVFIAVNIDINRTTPILKNKKPVTLPVSKIVNYFDEIGENTQYIIHPEEILADNFVLMINGDKNLKTPLIIQNMKKVLSPSG